MDWQIPDVWARACRWCPHTVVPGSTKQFKISWKTDKDLDDYFYEFEDAVKFAEDDIIDKVGDGADFYVALTACLRGSKIAAFDVDLHKPIVTEAMFKTKDFHLDRWREYFASDDSLRSQKIKLVEYALKHHHVRRSTHGGFHIIVLDPDGELPEVGGSKHHLCEIKTKGLLFVKPTVANNLPIVKYTPELMDWYYKLKKGNKKTARPTPEPVNPKPEATLTPVTTDIFGDTDNTLEQHELDKVLKQLTEAAKFTSEHKGIKDASLLYATDEDGFFQLCKYLTGILPSSEFVGFCRTQPYVLKQGQSTDDYFQGVQKRFESIKPNYPVKRRLDQFFSFYRKRMDKARELVARATPKPKTEPYKKPLKVTREEYDKIPVIKPTRPLDVPSKKIVAVFGPSNVGKTSIVLDDLVRKMLPSGQRVLMINNDMLHGEIRPYLYSFGFKDSYNLHIYDEENVMSKDLLANALHDVKPDILIVDTLDTMLLQCDSKFSFDSWQTCESAIGWLKQLIQPIGCGVLGLFHTPKTPPGCFNLPHSAKLKGAVFQSWLVMDNNHVEMNGWHRKDIRGQWSNEPEGTIIIYPDKVRAGNKNVNGYFVRFDGEVDTSLTLGGDWIPMLPCPWKPIPIVPEAKSSKVTTDIFDDKTSEVSTIDDVCLRVAKRAGGVGEGFKITETEALRALNCYGRDLSSEAETRRNLYSKAKLGQRIGFEGNVHKGYRVWVTIPNPEAERNKFKSRGWQY